MIQYDIMSYFNVPSKVCLIYRSKQKLKKEKTKKNSY